MTPATRRVFCSVGSRRVHYRRAGEGPPIVLIHGSPASSEILDGEIAALAPTRTCFAFDTPGFGDSDPLPGDTLHVADLADALQETLRALAMPPCVVFGSHTGAAIALELGRRHPQRASALVLDGLAMYDATERAALFDGYFEPLKIDALGGHFAHVWTRFRDLFQWFPWTHTDPAHLNEADVPTPERLQRWVGMFYRAAAHYVPAYRAAIDYGSDAAAAVAALPLPAVFMAQDTDMLFPHLARLPPLRANQWIVRTTPRGKAAALVAAVHSLGAVGGAPADPRGLAPSSARRGCCRRGFIDLPHGQVLVRSSGDPAHPALLSLPDSPGSSRALEAQQSTSEAPLHRLTLDLPGSGESPPLGPEPPVLSQYAAAVVAVLDALGIARCAVEAEGYGTALGLALAQLAPQRIAGVALRGVCLPGPSLRASLVERHAEPLRLEPDGAHWYRTWLMLRDSRVRFPWYDGAVAALRRVELPLDGPSLHEQTFEVLKQAQGWHHLIQAALGDDVGARLAALPGPALLLRTGSRHPFAAFDGRVLALRPDVATLPDAAPPRAVDDWLLASMA